MKNVVFLIVNLEKKLVENENGGLLKMKLKYCKKCNQMTNHRMVAFGEGVTEIYLRCVKCEER